MSQTHFAFKQFTIHQEHCAMKVGTDGVLLGAWASLQSSSRILDIGTGTGVIALMAAQRCPSACVIGVDIDADAVRQARKNVESSPFANRITVYQADIREDNFISLSEDGGLPFDAILCNPPFFENALRCPDPSRSAARHNDTLSLDDLARKSSELLSPDGTLSVVLPFDRRTDMIAACVTYGLALTRETRVQTLCAKPPKRVLLEFSRCRRELVSDILVIDSAPGEPTPAFKALLRDFYLKF